MALSTSELNFVRETQQIARQLLELKARMSQQTILFSGAPNLDEGITQADLDANFPESGMTVQALADVLFAYNGLSTSIGNAEVALVTLANLP